MTRTKFGERSFSYAGPAAWNTLPHYVHEITDSAVFKDSLNLFYFVERFLIRCKICLTLDCLDFIQYAFSF